MALLLRGKSRCPLCGEVIGAEEVVLFPAGLFPGGDPAFVVNDASVHPSCIAAEDWGQVALERRSAYVRAAEIEADR